MENLIVVVGGQFGSEGKGAVVGHLARRLEPTDINVRVAGPNAGHTVYGPKGDQWKLRQIPAGAVTSDCQLYIAPGSEVDPEVLYGEITALGRAGYPIQGRLRVDPSATVIEDDHKRAEQGDRLDLVGTIGSTGKGIGAARADRALRIARTFRDLEEDPTAEQVVARADLVNTRTVLIEGTQGYGLGVHTGFYPYTTSTDCRAVDFCAMAGVSPWQAKNIEVWVVVRPYPIRVAGNSGPLHSETTWAELGLPEERTTVTDKIRRVGRWDPDLVADAVRANGGAPTVRLALTMLDQVFPELAGVATREQIWGHPTAMEFLSKIEAQTGAPVAAVGTSPTTLVELPERVGLE